MGEGGAVPCRHECECEWMNECLSVRGRHARVRVGRSGCVRACVRVCVRECVGVCVCACVRECVSVCVSIHVAVLHLGCGITTVCYYGLGYLLVMSMGVEPTIRIL